jgi:hypothetical protein
MSSRIFDTLFDDYLFGYAPRDPRGQNREHPIPPEPTLAEPGTEAKLLVMRERDSAGYCVHHPLDARADYEKASSAHKLLPSEVNGYGRDESRPTKYARWCDEDEVA